MSVSQTFLDSISTVFFTSAADIDAYFIKTGGEDFVSWFNKHVAGQGNWGNIEEHAALMIANDSDTHDRFNQLWSAESLETIYGTGKITLLQFLVLQSIIINETGGRLVPLTEGVGSAGHPDIAYAFDSIAGFTRSYNTKASNKTCFQNFNDPNYNIAFGMPLWSIS